MKAPTPRVGPKPTARIFSPNAVRKIISATKVPLPKSKIEAPHWNQVSRLLKPGPSEGRKRLELCAREDALSYALEMAVAGYHGDIVLQYAPSASEIDREIGKIQRLAKDLSDALREPFSGVPEVPAEIWAAPKDRLREEVLKVLYKKYRTTNVIGSDYLKISEIVGGLVTSLEEVTANAQRARKDIHWPKTRKRRSDNKPRDNLLRKLADIYSVVWETQTKPSPSLSRAKNPKLEGNPNGPRFRKGSAPFVRFVKAVFAAGGIPTPEERALSKAIERAYSRAPR